MAGMPNFHTIEQVEEWAAKQNLLPYKKWPVIYPCYLDSNSKLSKGRRLPKR
jgi:hypothetical protein